MMILGKEGNCLREKMAHKKTAGKNLDSKASTERRQRANGVYLDLLSLGESSREEVVL